MKNSIVPAEIRPEQLPAVLHPEQAGIAQYSDWNADGPREEEPASQAANLRRYIAALKRFWWLIAGLTAIGTTLGLVATRYVEPTYEAHGAVWISDAGPNGGNGGQFKAPTLLPNGSWIELIKSFAVVDRVVIKRHLWYKLKNEQDSLALDSLRPSERTVPGDYTLALDQATGRYTLSEAKRGVIDQGVIGDSIGRRIGLLWVPTAAQLQGKKAIGFWVAQPRSTALGLIKGIDVSMSENSNFLKLTLTGYDKWKTAELLNVWMLEFVEKAKDLRRRNMSDVATILESQRTSAENNLRSAEMALQDFRTRVITDPGEGVSASTASSGGAASDLLASKYFRMQDEFETLKRDRESLDSIAVSAQRGIISPEAIAGIPAAVNAPSLQAAVKELVDKETELRKLRATYTEESQQVRTLAAAVDVLRRQTIPAFAINAAAALRKRENQLAAKINVDSAELRGLPQRSIEEARLRRNVSTAENLYNNLENKYESMRLGAVSIVPDVNILDPALPSSAPQRNTIILLVAGGIFGSLFFGIALALLLDLIDYRFRYPEQITHELKLNVIGAVPAVPKPGEEASDPEAMLQSVEAFRGLRMGLHHAFSAPPVMLTVTSPGAGDGKSMVTSNLALSFAEAGYRTLLIDGDIRRGKLHAVFNIARRPGLLDYLAGDVEIPAILREVPSHRGLTIIPSGTRRHRGPELLTSARLPALLTTMRSRYDVILVDCAPLAAGVDAYALGVATGNIVLVMRTGYTDRRVAKAKLKLTERLPMRIIGAIVNAVPAAGLYTEYSYLYGYAPDSDPEAPLGDEIPRLQSVDQNDG